MNGTCKRSLSQEEFEGTQWHTIPPLTGVSLTSSDPLSPVTEPGTGCSSSRVLL